ncbi:MAG: DUF2357 domain-containing protein [Rhodobacteraceae bacterium]|nr:DUF2357 domain-containing protein [Paracoccaceae bacterium]
MILDPSKIWIFESLHSFGRALSGLDDASGPIAVEQGVRVQRPGEWGNRPPVIAAMPGAIEPSYPKLEGRHRQTLPRVFRANSGTMGQDNNAIHANLHSGNWNIWLVPWRTRADSTMVITVNPGTMLTLNVRDWPQRSTDRGDDRSRILRQAGHFLTLVPGIFATTPSISAAYSRLDRLWETVQDVDPQQDLLKNHANRLQPVLQDLLGHPRVVLRSEHSMQKLQNVRRVDAKSLRWLSAQPGRNTPERAGARQRIMVPKRDITVDTLENRVLRAFAMLTVQESDEWLRKNPRSNDRQLIQAHQSRARRIERALGERRVRVADYPVKPNFPLRFDFRYREIWRAWKELRESSSRLETEWMWQERTLMELLGLRAAMILQKNKGGEILSHAPVLPADSRPEQGRFLKHGGVDFVIATMREDSLKTIPFHSGDRVSSPGAVADVENEAVVWWTPCAGSESRDRENLPGLSCLSWDQGLKEWADSILA